MFLPQHQFFKSQKKLHCFHQLIPNLPTFDPFFVWGETTGAPDPSHQRPTTSGSVGDRVACEKSLGHQLRRSEDAHRALQGHDQGTTEDAVKHGKDFREMVR